jgi:hypothetical protein
MHIISEQLGRIKHFLIILVLLFIVNAGFNFKYDWGGISVIARVYILVLSFYIIFIFSQLDLEEYRISYRNDFGWKGKYYLFLATRIFPFLFIYLLTVIFTLINYINIGNWPVEPVLRIFDGRYSNTIIYSLILFLVLKQKKRPGISIPLFIIFSVCYFLMDKILYYIFDPGTGVSVIKISKYIIFIFVLIYDFSKSRWKLIESVIFSISTGLCVYGAVLGLFVSIFFLSPEESAAFSISGEIILKSGFKFPLAKLQKQIIENGTYYEIRRVFIFTEKYGRDTDYEISDWEKIINRSRIEKNEFIFSYLNRKKIKLDFQMIKNYTENQLQVPPQEKSGLENFAKHLSSYYMDNRQGFFSMYRTGNMQIRILIIRSLAYTGDADAISFLIDELTNIETSISSAAYKSLMAITGKDPAAELSRAINDLDVVLWFRNYASEFKK